MGMKEYRIPPSFYWDHTYRDLPESGVSQLVKDAKTYVIVRLDEAAADDLYGDADFYSDAAIARDMGMPGLAASARATVKALVRQGYQPPPPKPVNLLR